MRPLNQNLGKSVSTRLQLLENDVMRPVVENDVQKNTAGVETVPNNPVARHDDIPDVVAVFDAR